MTGWEVVEAVRTRAPATQIIMITGSVSNLDMDRARTMSLALLPKPLRLEDLRRAVESDRSSTNASVIGS
jgi:CheY-like chemotaxis protein